MKNFITATLIGCFLSLPALACQAPIRSSQQLYDLDRELNSNAFAKEMAKQVAQSWSKQIKSIQMTGETVDLMTNNHAIKLKSHYRMPESNGMCPRFLRVTAKTTCAQ